MRKKLYYIKYEVIATSIKRALQSKGTAYEISLAEERLWPEEKKKKTGFKN